MSDGLERRAAAELRATAGGRLEGYAAVWDSESQDLGGFVETVRRGAFTRSLAHPDNITALYDHDRRAILGRVGAGTLRLAEDGRGLHFDVQLPPTSVGKDLAVLVERGDVRGASFAFKVPKGGDRWDFSGPVARRELLDVDLLEITITAQPAYLDTTVAKRTLREARDFADYWRVMAGRYLETCR